MPIDVSGLNSAHLNQADDSRQVGVSRSEADKGRSETGGSQTNETVSLTETAAQLQTLTLELQSLPVVDSQRVENVRQALHNGSFEVNEERVAEKLTQLEQLIRGR